MGVSEELREALLNLEEARRRENRQRIMAETLLEGLRVLVTTTDLRNLFPRLFPIMREPLGFEEALVLSVAPDNSLSLVASSTPLFAEVEWRTSGIFRRAMEGNPVAVFDTEKAADWPVLPEALTSLSRSALIFPLQTGERPALFLCTHPERAHFSREHIRLAHRFSMLAAQALRQMESSARLADLKERLDTEERMTALNRRLAESEKRLAKARKMEALGLLAGGVAHDLNNILSGIVSYPQLLLMDDDLSEEYRDIIETIQDAGQRAVAVVADLLTVARGVAGHRQVLNLNELIDQHLRTAEHRQLAFQHSQVEVVVHPAVDLLNIRASQVHVQKALMNLIANAFDALSGNKEGKITITTGNRYLDREVKSGDEMHTGEYVVLSVADNGPGIAPEDMERLFEPFFTKKHLGRSGTGLGLTIVWNTMQDHEGYVDVQTGPDGTTFTLYFSACRDAVEEQPTRISLEDLRGNQEKILVVDDQEDQRKIACAFLTRLGYSAEAVAGGEAAVAYVEKNPVDLLILDMIMDPGISGRETYERISSFQPNQRALIASGYTLSDDVEATQRLGAGAYIRKPYTLEALGLAVKSELEKSNNSD